ncbi:MAG: cobalamin biosynthesis protein CobQ, partial [Thermotogaceae bacterium]|nr:cobalamin biosynthesis protein CobQ [Thermotogaceae bacterium]
MKKNHAFIGPFGSGKTEIALNFAIKEVKKGKKVALADLDFVSPYFRSRDEEELLNEYGIVPVFP